MQQGGGSSVQPNVFDLRRAGLFILASESAIQLSSPSIDFSLGDRARLD
jgi:hypothetical protein